MADGSLGYLGAAGIFGGALALVALAHYTTRISKPLLFWSAFILTRPLGAVVGDFLDKPVAHGGLELSRLAASAVLAAGIVLLALVSLTPLGTGCSSPEERALYHIERGREFAAVGKDAAAIIEFRTAFSFDSQSLTALTELANTAEKKENRHDFRFYLRQMLTIDPNDAFSKAN